MAAREVILDQMDEIAGLISSESGKPVAEAISMEIAPVLERRKAVEAEKNRYRFIRTAGSNVKDRLSTARGSWCHTGMELSVLDPAR